MNTLNQALYKAIQWAKNALLFHRTNLSGNDCIFQQNQLSVHVEMRISLEYRVLPALLVKYFPSNFIYAILFIWVILLSTSSLRHEAVTMTRRHHKNTISILAGALLNIKNGSIGHWYHDARSDFRCLNQCLQTAYKSLVLPKRKERNVLFYVEISIIFIWAIYLTLKFECACFIKSISNQESNMFEFRNVFRSYCPNFIVWRI